MQEWPLKIRLLKPPRYIPLRYRFIFLSSSLLVLLFGAMAVLLGMHQAQSIRSQLERRGMAMANSIAAISKAALATYNYVALEQTVNQAVQDPETLYVAIHDKEGRVAAFSGRADLQGKILDDPVSRVAVAAAQPIVQEGLTGPGAVKGLDIAVPVYIPGSELRWGTVRVALSLEPMVEQIRAAQIVIGCVGMLALMAGVLVAYGLARMITRPLADLTLATVKAARGDLEQTLDVSTRDEVEVLASNFMVMTREILFQRRQLESQLREIQRLQRYTEQLLTTMNDGLLAIDREGHIATINPAAQAMLDLPKSLPEGHSVQTVLRDAPKLNEYLTEMLGEQGAWSQREIGLIRGGEEKTMLASSSVLKDTEGNILELIVNLHDVTEMKRLEARMRQADRLAALGVLAAGMAHEIRNPLSAIKTFVQLLPRKVHKEGFLEKFNRTVPRELDRINGLIEDLLELARTPRYYIQPLQIEPLVRATLDLFEEALLLNGVQIEIRFDAGLPAIEADPSQLTKALQNILRNAMQAMPNGGILSIEGFLTKEGLPPGQGPAQKDWVVLRFTDTGMGMSPETLSNVFNPFFTTKDHGTGLGMAITHKIVTEHGGFIDVSSERGQGTTVTIYFPFR
jgi:two-component system sensor histidine kinase AtoS